MAQKEMMPNSKRSKGFWMNLCLINLCIVALFGVTLRSKILFSLPFIDYRNILSAHSHFAFGGWAGLSLMTLLVYELLPPDLSQKRSYQWILAGIAVSSLGMALFFPAMGYNFLTIFFSSLYIVVYFIFAPVFIKDMLRHHKDKSVRLLSISAIASLLVSSIGPLGLVYILLSQSGNSLLYRDSIYTFLHFQYNGFFTLSIFALFFNYVLKKRIVLNQKARRFAVFLCLSIVPSLFLAMLWHNKVLFYVIAAIGCLLMLLSLFYFLGFLRSVDMGRLFFNRIAHTFWLFSALSFGLKMLLNVGTLFPALGNAVYGARPVIIGFLHLVFLGFLTFYILAVLIEQGYFTRNNATIRYPFYVFATGIIANEVVLMLQGVGVLFKTNSSVFNWLLWGTSLLLFTGAVLIAVAGLASFRTQKYRYKEV